jgi:hypothetical protein
MPFGNCVVYADMGWVRPGSLVVFVGATLSYVAPFVPQPQSVQFLGLTDVMFESRGYRLADAALAVIQSRHGPIAIIWSDSEGWRLPSLQDMGLAALSGSCRNFFGSYDAYPGGRLHACAAKVQPSPELRNSFWRLAAERYSEIAVPMPTAGWSYAAFVHAVGDAARGKRYVDKFEYLWSRRSGYPIAFDQRIMANTLYILNPSLMARARRAMNGSRDLFTRIDGILVLAPGWLVETRKPQPQGDAPVRKSY